MSGCLLCLAPPADSRAAGSGEALPAPPLALALSVMALVALLAAGAPKRTPCPPRRCRCFPCAGGTVDEDEGDSYWGSSDEDDDEYERRQERMFM